jgi:glycerate kinase
VSIYFLSTIREAIFRKILNSVPYYFLPLFIKRMAMHILVAFDSFKESMTSLEAARAFRKGFAKAGDEEHSFDIALISDGGEGFMDALIYGRGKRVSRQVTGPLGEPLRASYGFIASENCAVIEMAQATGLELVPVKKRNPMKVTSYGTGELIAAALKRGAQDIIVGLGGSASVDGGIGMAQALGVQFFDKRGKELAAPLTGKDLARIDRISCDQLHPRLAEVRITVACDVTNPLCGKRGAAHVFGPQKGATPAMVKKLDESLAHLATVIKRDLGVAIKTVAGGGAAGGIGVMLKAIAQAELKSGIDIVLDSVDFAARAEKADLIVTGEGRVDFQSLDGKAISGIAARAQGVSVLAVGGSVEDDHLDALYGAGITATLPLVTRPVDLATAIAEGKKAMVRAGERAARMMML